MALCRPAHHTAQISSALSKSGLRRQDVPHNDRHHICNHGSSCDPFWPVSATQPWCQVSELPRNTCGSTPLFQCYHREGLQRLIAPPILTQAIICGGEIPVTLVIFVARRGIKCEMKLLVKFLVEPLWSLPIVLVAAKHGLLSVLVYVNHSL